MRLPPVMLAPYLILAACVGGGYLWYLGDIKAGIAPIESEDVTIGGPFTLTDQNDVKRRAQDYRGKYMLVFFGFTYCPDVCPTTLGVVKTALDKLGTRADRIVPILITVDPERDTPEVMREYLKSFGDEFVGLTGSVADVTAAAKAYRVYFQKRPQPDGPYTMDHSSIIYLMGPDGRYVTHYLPEQGPDRIATDLNTRM